ncbi:MAG: histidinol-phosphatase [Butyribacter sp.]|nr:histidinol-phosphatase [bacterium]MDY3854409.1 histidinol-phosphatase [Butyribacter sp.]
MYANYHTHTKRCQHAEGEDREYVETAIEAGIKILGFSDHCPWVFADDYVSFMRMPASEVENYFSSLERLKDEYKNDIKILIGFEAEYIPELMEKQEQLLNGYPLDYMILGQHFLGVESNNLYTGAPTTDEATLKLYVDTVIEAVNTGKYLYVAHPDVLNYVGDSAIYEKHMTRLCNHLKSKNIPVEINMLGAFEGRHYPSEHFLRIAQKVQNNCIIGMDAHSPAQLKNQKGLDICNQLAEKHGLEVVKSLLG